MRRLRPIARGHCEDDERAGDRDAPVVFAVAVDPFIDDGSPAARESRQPFRKLIGDVGARQPQQHGGSFPVELRHACGLGQGFGFAQKLLPGLEGAGFNAQEEKQILVAQGSPVEHRRERRDCRIGEKLALHLPLRVQSGNRCRQPKYRELLGVQRQPHIADAGLDAIRSLGKLNEPAILIPPQIAQMPLRCGVEPGAAFFWVRQQPVRRDDFASHAKRQILVQRRKRKRDPVILGQLDIGGNLAQLHQAAAFWVDLIEPVGDRAAFQNSRRLRPVFILRRCQREGGGRNIALAFKGKRWTFRRRVSSRLIMVCGDAALARDPAQSLIGLPALGVIARQQPLKQLLPAGLDVLGHRHAARYEMQQEGAIVNAGKAGTVRRQLQQDDTKAPPIGRAG